MKILLVEDDHLLATCLSSSLSAQRYVVDVATDGLAGRDFAKAIDYDLIVLDINLPKLDGINLCYQLRKQIYTGPILMLTARANPNDKVLGLDAGADDYVVKPCSIEELCARIRALLRRQKSLDNTLLTWGDLSFNPITCEVRYQGKELLLSPKEYGLLELFLRNPQRIFSSNAILDHLWTFEDSPREETVRSHMKRLRQKLKSSGVEEMIETIYGMGYRLYPPPPTAIMPPCNPTPIALANQARLAALQAWDQLQELMEQRLHILAKASLALQQQSLSVELHHQAIQAAHKMAGSLGMFGLNQASEIGREIERWLQTSELTENISHFQALVSQLQQILQQPIASFPALDSDLATTKTLQADPLPKAQQPLIGETRGETRGDVKVLAVDDDPLVLNRLQAILPQWGISLRTLENSDQVIDNLDQAAPDLLILDIEMPEPNGIVLCQTIRDHPRWHAVPILFLSARQDAETIHRIYTVGADDYIPKPWTEPELVARIFNHLDHNRISQGCLAPYSSPGSNNRQQQVRKASIKEINRLLGLCRLYRHPFCLAVLELKLDGMHNQFPQESDRLLKQTFQQLQALLPEEAVIILWQDIKFVIGLYDRAGEVATQLLSQLLQTIQQEMIAQKSLYPYPIKFSAGLASFPDQGQDFHQLYYAASRTLGRS